MLNAFTNKNRLMATIRQGTVSQQMFNTAVSACCFTKLRQNYLVNFEDIPYLIIGFGRHKEGKSYIWQLRVIYPPLKRAIETGMFESIIFPDELANDQQVTKNSVKFYLIKSYINVIHKILKRISSVSEEKKELALEKLTERPKGGSIYWM